MNVSPAPLLATPDYQLYHQQFRPHTGLPWKVGKEYPVSLFFYLKGGKADLVTGDTVVSTHFLSNNKRNMVLHEKTAVALTWQQTTRVEFIEIRFKKAWLARLLQEQLESWMQQTVAVSASKGIQLCSKSLSLQDDFHALLNGILSVGVRAPQFRSTILASKLQELAVLFLERPAEKQQVAEVRESHVEYANMARTYIDMNTGKKTFTIIGLAKSLDTNETTLKKAFKALYGKPIFRYYQERVMEVAVAALKEGVSVEETSFRCGYSHVAHFSVAFKRYYGIAPSRYALQQPG